MESYLDKTIYVLGLGKSGIAAANKLSALGAKILAFDDSDIDQERLKSDVKIIHYEKTNWSEVDYLMLSPGIPYKFPKSHDIVKLAHDNNVEITCDIELFLKLTPKAKTIAITGTNGKSTSTALIAHILKSAGQKVEFGGNIGKAIFELPINDNEEQIYVLELSSYQLDLINNTAFDYAILLNISPDHIERHGSFDNYVATKKRIFSDLKKLAIIGVDDSPSQEIFGALKTNKSSISNSKINADYSLKDINQEIEIEKFGNAQNILSALVIAESFKITPTDFVKYLQNFNALEHRMEFLGSYKMLRIFNDSKATNAQSALNAIKQLDNIIWIAGGVAKEGGIEIILPFLNKMQLIYLIGESKEEFKKQLEKEGFKNYKICSNLKNILEDVKNINIAGDLLFSPAAASFDMWKNFEERGREFKKLVKKIFS